MTAITGAAASSETYGTVDAICVRLHSKAPNAASMTPVIERHTLSRRADEVVVAVEAAGVNPSDVKAATLVEKPPEISMEEAAGIGVPFVTAIEGFRRSAMPKPGEHVLILGVNGKVGQAAAQLATWQGASVIGVVRKDEPYEGHANSR